MHMVVRNKKAAKKGKTAHKGKTKISKPATRASARTGGASGDSAKKTALKGLKKASTQKAAAKKRPASSARAPKAKTVSKGKSSAKSSGRKAGSTASGKKTASRAPAKKKAVSVSKKPAAGGKAPVKNAQTQKKARASAAQKKTAVKKVKTASAGKKSPKKKPVMQTSPLKVSAKTKTKATKSSAQQRVSPARRAGGGHAPPIKPPFEAYKGVRSYLFTSYAHQDMKTVFDIIKKLYNKRYRIWYDEGIEPGNEWPEIVGKAIVNCTQFLVLMSPHAAVSRNVRNEINLAFTENKNILVVFLKKTSLTEGMKLQIGTVQFINKHELSQKEFLEKLDKVLDSCMKN